MPLHFASPRVSAAQVRENRGYEEPLLRLSHVVFSSRLADSMLDEEREPPLFDLAGRLLNEQRHHVLQHHRLQLQAARSVALFDKRAAAQGVDCRQHLPWR